MRLVWTKGNTIFSKLIMWTLNEPVSHFAIVFDEKIVFHSDLLGVRLAWYPSFLKKHEVIFTKEYLSLTLDMEEFAYQNIINKFDGSGYDLKAAIYFGWRGLLKKWFNLPFPKHNKANSSDKFFCSEMIQTLPPWIYENKDLDMTMLSPHQLWLLLENYQPITRNEQNQIDTNQ